MNYLRHFGLREPPFGITPDTTYFFACRSIQEALNTLLVAVANGEGFIKITGEVGTGKTLRPASPPLCCAIGFGREHCLANRAKSRTGKSSQIRWRLTGRRAERDYDRP